MIVRAHVAPVRGPAHVRFAGALLAQLHRAGLALRQVDGWAQVGGRDGEIRGLGVDANGRLWLVAGRGGAVTLERLGPEGQPAWSRPIVAPPGPGRMHVFPPRTLGAPCRLATRSTTTHIWSYAGAELAAPLADGTVGPEAQAEADPGAFDTLTELADGTLLWEELGELGWLAPDAPEAPGRCPHEPDEPPLHLLAAGHHLWASFADGSVAALQGDRLTGYQVCAPTLQGLGRIVSLATDAAGAVATLSSAGPAGPFAITVARSTGEPTSIAMAAPDMAAWPHLELALDSTLDRVALLYGEDAGEVSLWSSTSGEPIGP